MVDDGVVVRWSSARTGGDAETRRDDVPSRHLLRIEDLAGAFSPRIAGESTEHTSLLAGLDEQLPPIVVHRPTMRVVDGMHRVRAAVLRGETFIEAVFFDGNEDDAFVLAVELNHAHGLPLSIADRKAAAARILNSCPEWSDRRIAAVTGLSASTIGSIRRRSTERIEQLNSRIGRDGKARPRDGAEGRLRAGELVLSNPTASLRGIARAAGVSSATARDVRARIARGEPPLTDSQQRSRLLGGARSPVSARTRQSSEAKVFSEPGVEISDDLSSVIGVLAQDPSLRGSEAGRALLRSLGCVTADRQQWSEIARSVPAHQRNVVVRLAKDCAALWQAFAQMLERSADGKQ